MNRIKITRPENGNPYSRVNRVQRPVGSIGGNGDVIRGMTEAPRVEPPKARAPMPQRPTNRPSFLWEW